MHTQKNQLKYISLQNERSDWHEYLILIPDEKLPQRMSYHPHMDDLKNFHRGNGTIRCQWMQVHVGSTPVIRTINRSFQKGRPIDF